MYGNKKGPNDQSNLEKEEQSWRYHIPIYQTVLQSHSNPNSIVLAQKLTDRLMEWNRIENPEINSFTYDQLVSDKGKIIHGGKTVSSISGAVNIGQPHVKQ